MRWHWTSEVLLAFSPGTTLLKTADSGLPGAKAALNDGTFLRGCEGREERRGGVNCFLCWMMEFWVNFRSSEVSCSSRREGLCYAMLSWKSCVTPCYGGRTAFIQWNVCSGYKTWYMALRAMFSCAYLWPQPTSMPGYIHCFSTVSLCHFHWPGYIFTRSKVPNRLPVYSRIFSQVPKEACSFFPTPLSYPIFNKSSGNMKVPWMEAHICMPCQNPWYGNRA